MSSITAEQTANFRKKQHSRVTEVPPAESAAAERHFSSRLSFETDCADVFSAMSSATVDFVLLDVRNAASYSKGHVPNAVNIPVLNVTEERLAEFSADAVFVVYCAGPHCNGANKAALRLARLGRPVKEMIGGALGWVDEGFSLETNA